MIEWWKDDNDETTDEQTMRVRAVAYYRHSAQDRQENSVSLQQEQVRQFADEHGVEIIKEFADLGKSGLTAEGRDDFNEMMDDWVKARIDFQYVLCLDVSRWGRFQDIDLSAQYSAECKRHGKEVIYTTIGKPKENDPLYPVYIQFERFRAAQYSRELSEKVYRGCANIAKQGYWPGGPPPYGFTRLLLDESRNPVRQLSPGERKSIQNQRVTLASGNADELSTITRIFREFVELERTSKKIAQGLNRDGIPSPGGVCWDGEKVRRILRNELYVGTMVYNKTTMRLKTPRRDNPREDWIRTPSSFQPIIDQTTFDRAQQILKEWTDRYTAQPMLENLQRILEQYEFLRPSFFIRPSAGTYARKFGSLDVAFQRAHGQAHEEAKAIVTSRIGKLVKQVEVFTDFLVLEKKLTVLIQPSVPALCGYHSYWSFQPDKRRVIDFTLGVALSGPADFQILGYIVMPRLLTSRRKTFRMSGVAIPGLELLGHGNLDFIRDLLM